MAETPSGSDQTGPCVFHSATENDLCSKSDLASGKTTLMVDPGGGD